MPKTLNSRTQTISKRKPDAGPSLGTSGPAPAPHPSFSVAEGAKQCPSPARSPDARAHPGFAGGPRRARAADPARAAPAWPRCAGTLPRFLRRNPAPLPPPQRRKPSEAREPRGADRPAPGSARRALHSCAGAQLPLPSILPLPPISRIIPIVPGRSRPTCPTSAAR